jgi:DNA-binding MarR family transcriptional regulator
LSEKEDLFQLISLVAMGLAGRIIDFEYKGMKFGRLIFCINYIGFKKRCSMSEIVDFLNLKPSTATRQIDKLVEEYHLVTRTFSEDDRRMVELELTDLGWEVYYHHRKMGELPTNLILQEFTQNEQLTIKRALYMMLTIFDEP